MSTSAALLLSSGQLSCYTHSVANLLFLLSLKLFIFLKWKVSSCTKTFCLAFHVLFLYTSLKKLCIRLLIRQMQTKALVYLHCSVMHDLSQCFYLFIFFLHCCIPDCRCVSEICMRSACCAL